MKFSKSYLVIAHDLFMSFLSFYLALILRFHDSLPEIWSAEYLFGGMLFVSTSFLSFHYFQMYKGMWRYASISDLVNILKAVTITVLVYTLISFLMTRLEDIPRSIPFMSWFISICLLSGSRLFYRLLKDKELLSGLLHPSLYKKLFTNVEHGSKIPLLLLGSGDEADLFIRHIQRQVNSSYHIVGILADRRQHLGRVIRKIPVLGLYEDFESVVLHLKKEKVAPQKLILTKPRKLLSGEQVAHLFDVCVKYGVHMVKMPKLTDFEDAKDALSAKISLEFRPVAIEDLLGRPQTNLHFDQIKELIEKQAVLITGSGGSIGSEITRQVAKLNPSQIILIENCEFNLYQITQEISSQFPGISCVSLMGDVRDQGHMSEIFKRYHPQIVFHAAALKHVPIAEENAIETIKTNILGTKNIADLCLAHKSRAMVLISTDKAVRPTNVMGSTKRIAEIYCQYLDTQTLNQSTRYLTVRFGNVLGSTGSVVPLFQKQLRQGGPLTVTHPDITRFFMTIQEAVKLVLEACAHGVRHQEYRGSIFVLDMGQPIKIKDLAEKMIKLAGLEPHKDVEIVYTGLRPGEKIYEELFLSTEPLLPSGLESIMLASPELCEKGKLIRVLKEFESVAHDEQRSHAVIVKLLQSLVPEYTPWQSERNKIAG